MFFLYSKRIFKQKMLENDNTIEVLGARVSNLKI
jgi:hypothetical protein